MRPCDREYFFGKPGERLFIRDWGPLDQPVILLVHGFPGCAAHGELMSETPYSKSSRLIAMDRPGYGQSELQPGITPMKFAEQVKRLLDENDIQKVSIISVSGGAPFSLAVAYLMGERVLKVSSVGGIAPLSVKNFSYLNPRQRKAWALRNLLPEFVLNYALQRVWQKGLDQLDQFLFTQEDTFTPADTRVLNDPEVGPMLVATTKLSLGQGPGALLQDMRVYSRHWGFPLEKIRCPVTLWHGSDDDIVHPNFAADMKRRLPHASFNVVPQEGHYSILVNRRDEIIGDLLAVVVKNTLQ